MIHHDRMLFHRHYIARYQQIKNEIGDTQLSKMKWYSEIFASIQQLIGEEIHFPDQSLLFYLQYTSKIIEQQGKINTELAQAQKQKDTFHFYRNKVGLLKTIHQQLKENIDSFESILSEREKNK